MKRLVIAETRTSSWFYHLRELSEGTEMKCGGLPPDTKALCGDTPFGWDTNIPLAYWGRKGSHIPEKFCKKCSDLLPDWKAK